MFNDFFHCSHWFSHILSTLFICFLWFSSIFLKSLIEVWRCINCRCIEVYGIHIWLIITMCKCRSMQKNAYICEKTLLHVYIYIYIHTGIYAYVESFYRDIMWYIRHQHFGMLAVSETNDDRGPFIGKRMGFDFGLLQSWTDSTPLAVPISTLAFSAIRGRIAVKHTNTLNKYIYWS